MIIFRSISTAVAAPTNSATTDSILFSEATAVAAPTNSAAADPILISEASATAVAAPTSPATTTEAERGNGVGEKEMVLPSKC